jgi:hypothetical protein
VTDATHLLTDEQMRDYLTKGYVVLRSSLPRQMHDDIYARTMEVFDKEGNPGNNILPRVPQLHNVFQDPVFRGALTSVLGPDHIMHSHRHCHVNRGPGEGGGVHKDSYWGYQRVRNHRTRWAMLFYYPQDAPEEIGPTGVVPGSQTYEKRESWEPLEQILPCVGEAGTAVLVHFDIWHRACPNLLEKTRFMMKFQFTRMSEPTAPTWNNRSAHWPTNGSNGGNGSGDRHRALWTRLWNWHRGEPFAAVDGPGIDAGQAQAILRDGDLTERMAAADSLAYGEGSAAVETLTQALRDDAEPVRKNAAYALANLGPAAIDPLVEALDDGDEAVRLDAAYGLSAVGPEAEAALRAGCREGSEARRGYAAFALGEMGAAASGRAVTALAGLAEDESEFVRRNAADALGTMTTNRKRAVEALTTLLGDESGQVRFDAAYGLARQGRAARSATPALAAALHDDNRYVRNHAAEALKRVGTPEAAMALTEFLEVSRWCPITTKESTF